MTELRSSTADEIPLQASKWLSIQALLDSDETALLLDALRPFYLFHCGSVHERNQSSLSSEEFLKHYRDYIESLKSGQMPEQKEYRPWFSPALTNNLEALYKIPIGDDKELVRISKPVIQLQAHHLDFSPIDKKFRSMVLGTDSIPWGLQFSYPQLYLDPLTKQVEQVKNSRLFPNTDLFQKLQKWMRQHTIPTPFWVEGIRYVVPMRLGKKCMAWINQHPQLLKKGISVN